MANRKQQNLEIERHLKKRKFISRIVALVVIAVLVVGTAIGIWTVQDRQWFMRYDGGRVATADFRAFFHLNFENNPAARQAAITSLQGIVLLRDRAIEHGVDFTPEEREAAEQWAQDMRAEFHAFNLFDGFYYISDARLAELFHTTGPFTRLADIYVPTYDLDVEEFTELWEAHVERFFYNYSDMQIHYLFGDDPDEFEAAASRVGIDPFEDIMRDFYTWLDDESEIEPMALTGQQGLMPSLIQMLLQPEDQEHVLSLQAGEYSHSMQLFNLDTGEMFQIIVYVVSRNDFDLDEIETGFRENIVRDRRHELFETMILEWVDEANFVINQRGYNTTISPW